MVTLQSVLDLLKLAPRYGLFSGALLLLPQSITERLGVDDFAKNYRQGWS